ncbi:MAG: PilZ domain-containing protein [Myxococcota bacterium]
MLVNHSVTSNSGPILGTASVSCESPAIIDAELGLAPQVLEDTLQWARGRADELLAALDDQELRELLGPFIPFEASPQPEAPAAATSRPVTAEFDAVPANDVAPEPVLEAVPPAVESQAAPETAKTGAEQRKDPRKALVDPVLVKVDSWSELVRLYTRDISCGGMFIHSEALPSLESQVSVELLLPEEAGSLHFQGVVVHVVEASGATSPGFGIQFVGLTAESRRTLQRIIERAEQAASTPREEGPTLQELGFTCAPSQRGGLRLTLSEAELSQLRELRSELAAMKKCGDLELLGVGSAADLDELRVAFERLAERWHPGIAHRDAPAEIRTLVTEVFLRIEQAYQRASSAARRQAQRAFQPAEARPVGGHEDAAVGSVATVVRSAAAGEVAGTGEHESASATPAAAPRRKRPITGVQEAAKPDAPKKRRPITGVQEAADAGTPKAAASARRSRPTTGVQEAAKPVARSADEASPETAAKGTPTPARAGARRRVGRLVERGERLARKLQRREHAVPKLKPRSPRPSAPGHSAPMKVALQHIQARSWADAIKPLQEALQLQPSNELEVLLQIVRARQAAVERDFATARRHYEAVLAGNPEHAVAQRELLMISAVHDS